MRTATHSFVPWLGLLVALSAMAAPAQAQITPPVWASVQRTDAANPNSAALGEKIVVAADGSQFVSGRFEGTVSFGSTTIAAGTADAGLFLAKYNPSGTLAWVRYATGPSDDSRAVVAVDPAGNAILTGYFEDALTFSGTAIAPLSTPFGVTDSYVAKYDPQGTLLWTRAGGGTNGDSYAAAAGTDAAGNIYVAGDFNGSLSFGGAPISAVTEDIFLYKLTPAGAVVWARTGGGPSNDYAYALATDAAGNACLTGSVNQTATFGTVVLPGPGAVGDEDGFVVKYDPQGTAQWAQRFSTTNTDAGSSIALDAAGSVAVGGYTDGVFNATSDQSRIFVARYSSQGAQLWSRQFTPTVPEFYAGYGVAFDGRGGLYLTGDFQGTVAFGSTSLTATNVDMYAVRFDGQGNTVWADKVSSQPGNNGVISFDVATDAAGNAYFTGAVLGPAIFGTIATAGTGVNAFLARLSAGGVITGTRSAVAAAPLRVYPNPATDHAAVVLPAGGGHLVLTDALGRTVRKQELPAAAGPCAVPLTGLTPGLYHLRATLGTGQPASARLTVR